MKCVRGTVYNGYSDIAGDMNFTAKLSLRISNKLCMAYMYIDGEKY